MKTEFYNTENEALNKTDVSKSVYYSNELLENISNNATYIFNNKRFKGVKFSDEWYDSIIKLCEQAKIKNDYLQMEKDIESYKNRIKILQNLNTKYRDKLGISNEPVDALGLISPLDEVS